MPGWQAKFQKYKDEGFTIVGLALDVEGVAPAKRYYERFGVTFPSLVDPNYATKFGAVPKTFFIDEYGVVLDAKDWETQLAKLPAPQPVTSQHRAMFTDPQQRTGAKDLANLVARNQKNPADLQIAAELGSRYLQLSLTEEASQVLSRAADQHNAREIAQTRGTKSQSLAAVYLQLARANEGQRGQQVRYATLSFYLNPTVGFGKQIARIIAPEKFDRADGRFDNAFREATLRRLKAERTRWLAGEQDQP